MQPTRHPHSARSTVRATTTSTAIGGTTVAVQSGPIDPGMVLSSDEVVTSIDVGPPGSIKR